MLSTVCSDSYTETISHQRHHLFAMNVKYFDVSVLVSSSMYLCIHYTCNGIQYLEAKNMTDDSIPSGETKIEEKNLSCD